MEKVPELILKEKLGLCQLTRMDQDEIVVTFTNVEIDSLWAENEYWQRVYSSFGEKLTTNIPKAKNSIYKENQRDSSTFVLVHQYPETLQLIPVQTNQETQVINQEI